jgi:glycyl-tRNA synthetase alpha chain
MNTLCRLIQTLQNYWENQGCVVLPAWDMEIGAGTMSPYTFFYVLKDQPYRACYVQPSRRPVDGRYGENPNRVYKHHQMQVILKPSPGNIQDLYIDSLAAVGFPTKEHDIRFIEDNWAAPTLGAWGVGWEVWLDGMEITQFTYFQQVGSIELAVPAVEITYGLERISMYLQDKNSLYDLQYNENLQYQDLRKEEEVQQSIYCHEKADPKRLYSLFNLSFEEGEMCFQNQLIWPGYEYALKCSHIFNILDAVGALSVSERAQYLGRVRSLARKAANAIVATQKGGSPDES